ncbi:hypothetical protein [Paraburkholderia tagetis]|uniref:Uncharacterized protein n=1 Tax=Paraburkholderia tagetis TaxID=2913261 RepID=A0A9X1UNF5_9BURK|nr:hypothetical protein [Paraburkholderia tagetis]MCG5078674.1 hypothetical protein [Paraburkholderia tagetis]
MRHPNEFVHTASLNNICAKINLLRKWEVAGLPALLRTSGNVAVDESNNPMLDNFPASVEAVCAWTDNDNCRATLDGPPELELLRPLSRASLFSLSNRYMLRRMEFQTTAMSRKFPAEAARNKARGRTMALPVGIEKSWKRVGAGSAARAAAPFKPHLQEEFDL